MAVQQVRGNQQSLPTLSANQQDLLLAALNTQANGPSNRNSQVDNSGASARYTSDSAPQRSTMNDVNGNGLFMSPQQAQLDTFNGDFTPELDYLDDDFDFENADLGGEMIGSLPADGSNGSDLHDKRKNSDDDIDEEEGDAKRQEGEKGAKKPGRKPLTSEPTTKRKAQNRAAQRAFRERKEAHLKDLETKVGELTKTQQADKHENGLLKAQIERLQVELREYRKRLPLSGNSSANRSPPITGYAGQTRSNSNPSAYGGGSGFQFDFPKFGGLPGSQIFGNALANASDSQSNGYRSSATPPNAQSPTRGSFSAAQPLPQQGSRQNSMGRTSQSPRSMSGATMNSPSQMSNINPTFTNYSTNDNLHGFASTLPSMNGTGSDPFGDLFSPGLLKSASVDGNGNYFSDNASTNGLSNSNVVGEVNGGDSTAGLNRVFQFNSNSSTSDSASPSASSASQWNANANSSCDTSPEPSHGSPANQSKNADAFYDKTNSAKLQSPLAAENITFDTTTQPNNIDYSMPSVNTFDPVLFGDYRESHDGMLGGADFGAGFFDEALNPMPFDYNSPSNLFGILSSPQPQNSPVSVNSGPVNAPTPSKNLMAEIEKTRDGGDDDYGLPNVHQTQTKKAAAPVDASGKLISCNHIWNQLQSNPDFQAGTFDLDGLCSELRAKARCSESGVMVDQNHVDAALRKLGKKDDKTGKVNEGANGLMFEQESWDNVLKKLGNNR